MRVCIFGAGAIGGLMAARLTAKGDVQVTVIARGPHLAAMQANGLTLISDGQQIVTRPRCVASAEEAGPQDYVVVTLKARLRGERVEFTVHDNGPGIAPSIQSRVFEPFFSTRPAGTGLGLAVVKTVTEAHGGALALASTPETGTRFDLDLPRQAQVPDPPLAPVTTLSREVA